MTEINQLPIRDDLLIEKRWDRASSDMLEARSFGSEELLYRRNWYEVSGTGQLGYVKDAGVKTAFCEYLASRLASCAGLVVPQVDCAPFRSDIGTLYACFSPLIGVRPQTLDFFRRQEISRRVPSSLLSSIEQISKDISSLIPFWVWIANQDVHAGNVTVGLLSADTSRLGAYGIDHGRLSFQLDKIASFPTTTTILGLSHFFKSDMPFYIDADVMARTINAISTIPEDKIREVVQGALHYCQIPSSRSSESFLYDFPSSSEIQNVLIKRQQILEANIDTPAYMAKVFGISPYAYKKLNAYFAPGRPSIAVAAANTVKKASVA